MSLTEAAPPVATPETRAQRLRRATHSLHESLDSRLSDAKLFTDRDRYAMFLAMQRRFHADVDALYRDPRLIVLIPDLLDRRKLDLIDQDLADLGRSPPADPAQPADPSDRAAALGWLYVAEGSNLGAAFLLKEAAKLGLSESFGARSLAAHTEGRGLHWRRFTEALDGPQLTPDEEARAEAGAAAAFARVRGLAEETISAAG
jgi:heme oxygenase